jgi:hypothetical protein
LLLAVITIGIFCCCRSLLLPFAVAVIYCYSRPLSSSAVIIRCRHCLLPLSLSSAVTVIIVHYHRCSHLLLLSPLSSIVAAIVCYYYCHCLLPPLPFSAILTSIVYCHCLHYHPLPPLLPSFAAATAIVCHHHCHDLLPLLPSSTVAATALSSAAATTIISYHYYNCLLPLLLPLLSAAAAAIVYHCCHFHLLPLPLLPFFSILFLPLYVASSYCNQVVNMLLHCNNQST